MADGESAGGQSPPPTQRPSTHTSDPRQDVSARLRTFFAASHPSSTAAASAQPSSGSSSAHKTDADMRLPRPKSPMPPMHHPPKQSSSLRHSHPPSQDTMSMVSPAAEYSAARDKKRASKPVLPVLRWFSTKRPENKARSTPNSPVGSRPSTPSASQPDSPAQSAPSTPSSALSALADAFMDDPHILEAHSCSHPEDVKMPSRPKAARLPTALHRPSYFSSLTRSTMPTAYLSPPPSASYVPPRYSDPSDEPFPSHNYNNADMDLLLSPTPDPLPMPHSPAPVHLNSSPPTSSSLESLRSIHERSRSIHTSAPAQSFNFPQLPTSIRDWFAPDESAGKENLNPMLSEEDRGETAKEERENIRHKYVATKNPVVFCHGLLGFDTVTLGPSIAPLQVTHWRGIRDALEANGIEVLITRVPATSSPIDRAKVLCQKIAETYPGRAVHLIGHSMGGIDCRYLTTHLTDRPFEVLSVTTISSPHRGSSFADHFLETVGRERMPSVLSLLDLLPNGGGDGKAFEFLTIENMRRFNENTPDVPGVHYFSWGAVYEPGLIDTWKWPHSVVYEKEGPNDGLVSLKSARWGTYLGTLEGVNHLDLVGWINTARYKWAEIMGREIKFKPATFYLGIADHLARVVEHQEQPHDSGAGTGLKAAQDAAASAGSAEPEPESESSRAERDEREQIRREGERAEMADSLGKGGGEERESRRPHDPEGTPQPGNSTAEAERRDGERSAR
ncbi:Alpha/Beta hydrolase protein [Trametes polyzona]|nr:Alpha/Beta hydrolase protein [Trametes polyzona]